MLQINILHVGNIKDKFFADAVAEYEKRLSSSCKLRNIELKEEKPPENPSAAEISSLIRKEGDRLLASLPQTCRKAFGNYRFRIFRNHVYHRRCFRNGRTC